MTPEEQKRLEQIGAVMDILTVAYPQYYKNVSEDEKYAASLLWANMFADDSIEVVVAAVKTFIATDEKGFPPVIGQIKAHVAKIIGGAEKSELEAWGEVKRALRNSGYHAAEEFAKFDPVIQRIVGSPSQLREWSTVANDVVDSVIASNFQRSYRASAKQYREYLALPNHIKDFIKATSDRMALNRVTAEPEQKALPISVEAVINEAKAAITMAPPPKREIPKLLTPEEFEARKAEILKAIDIDNDQSNQEEIHSEQ